MRSTTYGMVEEAAVLSLVNGERRERWETIVNTRGDNNLGLWIAFGASFGTVLFALTGNAVWIGIGVSLAIAFALALGKGRNDEKAASPEDPHDRS